MTDAAVFALALAIVGAFFLIGGCALLYEVQPRNPILAAIVAGVAVAIILLGLMQLSYASRFLLSP